VRAEELATAGAGVRPRRAVLAALVLLIALPELILQAADLGLVGSARWRPMAYQYAAFWAGLLRDWRPNYAAQPVAMFLTYAVLHGGLGHLLGNVAAFVGFGPALLERLGTGRFLGLCLAATLGGAAAFGLLSASPQPMVGASGMLFGLAGAWQVLDARDRRAAGQPLWPVWAWVAALVALNLVFWVVQKGLLAWETHLGGYLAGAAVMALFPRDRG
jgi:membrane associated rhomboid family serine protease